MKNSKTPKKLVLTRTTLRRLTITELQRAAGGISGHRICHSIADICQHPSGVGDLCDLSVMGACQSGFGIASCTCPPPHP